MGAYLLFPATQFKHRASEIFVVPIHRDGQIGGLVFGLRGQFIVLSLYPGHTPASVDSLVPGLLPPPIGAAALHYRPTLFRVQSACGSEGKILLR